MTLKTSSSRRSPYGLFHVPFAVAASFAVLTGFTAIVFGLPLRDPDGFLGPSYIRLPLLLVAMILADVLPRTLWRKPTLRTVHRVALVEFRRRWPGPRLVLTSVGLATFYLAYVSYRNMKSFLPFVRDRVVDPFLQETDRWLMGGDHPGDVLQQMLGTGVSAHVLSAVYLSYLVFVPLSVAAALVWSRTISHGVWYVSALSFNWILGAASYYALPSLGPIYIEPRHFTDLADTGVTSLQESLYRNRVRVLADPHATESVHGIAAFASLHVSVVFTAALVAHLIRLPLVVRAALWAYVVLTALATVYFGWHYVVDVFAGAALGALATWLAAKATRSDDLPIRIPAAQATRVTAPSQ
ncbi:phosphatase PAP2 family protein [Arthrobacter sp. B1805]|uniref:phosphatase PAP2 family protein n=1 Tax=Arthrobacter sp. B1805 TaxID=2058892 RepID=UPI000CE4F862|nr:phosphatase PAP2 family protein [Arthrobacter sp. B1805]